MSNHKYAVSPADGPIVVTGASGYIGAWIVRDCVEQGYTVRACVRDAANPAKVDHLLKLNSAGFGGAFRFTKLTCLSQVAMTKPLMARLR